MANKAKHAYGSRKNLEAAIASGAVNAFDILLLNDEDEKPVVGWIDRDGNPVIAEPDFSEIEAELATKVGTAEVDEKIGQAVTDSVATAKSYTDGKIEAAINEHMAKKYEITSVPAGTLIDYRESEIRIMCPANAEWVKQSVGVGGDANSYYVTLKTYAPNEEAVGYIEHLGDQSDSEILTDIKTDAYGCRYQPTWLAVAKYDEASGTWSYYGAQSTSGRYIGWDYQIDWFNADGVMIASDCIRINLSNEECHSSSEPYFVGEIMKEVDVKIEEKITEVNSAYEVIEF